jgi:hypothetical protein
MLHACLYIICFVFCYTSWRFYAFSRTNLLMRCHSASSLLLLFLCFRKAIEEIFSELDETKAKIPIFPKLHEVQRRDKVVPKRGRTMPRRGPPWPCRAVVWASGPLPDAALPPIYSPRWENLKGMINFPRNLPQAAAIIDARLGGSRSSSRHPDGKGDHCRRPSSSPWPPSE